MFLAPFLLLCLQMNLLIDLFHLYQVEVEEVEVGGEEEEGVEVEERRFLVNEGGTLTAQPVPLPMYR